MNNNMTLNGGLGIEPVTTTAIITGASSLFKSLGSKMGPDAFFKEMGVVDKAIARALGLPESDATISGTRLKAAIDKARADGKFRYADVKTDYLKDYTPDLQRYVTQGGASILRAMGADYLVGSLKPTAPYIDAAPWLGPAQADASAASSGGIWNLLDKAVSSYNPNAKAPAPAYPGGPPPPGPSPVLKTVVITAALGTAAFIGYKAYKASKSSKK